MVDKKRKPKKGIITERTVSNLLSRYSVYTLLNLLIEVEQVADINMDWNALVSKTTTGITNAREYQMLWRHLAYQDPLLETLEEGAQPLDDDSDLEYDLEVHPPVSSEATAEAAACVKVLIASGLQDDSSLSNGMTIEAPLIINIPNYQLDGEASENEQHQGTNISIPVTVQKQHQSIATNVQLTEALDINGGNKKKRIPWTPAEDGELIAAVKKHGVGNWTHIVKDDFKGERTASQLSQRWSVIKRRKGVLNNHGIPQVSNSNLLATRNAVNLALKRPVDRLKASPVSNNVVKSNVPSAQSSQLDKGPAATTTTMTKSRLGISITAPIDPIKAAAVAAGARIATSQGKTPVIVSGLGLPPNVHFMRTGLVTASIASGVHQRPPQPQPQPQSSEDEEDDSIFDIFKSEASLAKKKQANHQVVIEQRQDPLVLLKDNQNQNQNKEKADVVMTEGIEEEQNTNRMG